MVLVLVLNLLQASDFLASDELTEEVMSELEKYRRQGVSGVPFFVINGEKTVSGAQDEATFVALFRRIAAKH